MANEIYQINQTGEDIAKAISNVLLGLNGDLAKSILSKVNSTVFENNNLPKNGINGDRIVNGTLTYDKTTGIQKQHFTKRISITGWSGKQATVSNIENLTVNSTVIVTPASDSFNAWQNSNVYCSGQGEGSLTFSCKKTPGTTINANILILN